MTDVLQSQQRYYAARAPEYDDWWYRRGRYAMSPEAEAAWRADEREVDAALDALGQLGDVVELAAGTGIWTRKLVRRAERVVALDVNGEVLARNTADAEQRVVDLFEWQPDEQFDLCFFGFWLTHVPEGRFDGFWSTVRAALKPGGRVFLVDNSGGGEATHVERRGEECELRTLADGRTFEIVKRRWTPEALRERVAPLGFELDAQVTANGHFVYGSGR